MRVAGSNTDLVFCEDGTFVGAYLAANYCSEHENGIKRIQDIFGVDRQLDQFGVESRRCKATDENILFLKRKSAGVVQAILYSEHGNYNSRRVRDYCLSEPKKPMRDIAGYVDCDIREDRISGSWSERGFAMYAPNAELTEHLSTLHQAFLGGDAIVMCGGGGVGGLSTGLV